jgi:polar amino acid transport system substrate-binding protein
VRAALWLAAVLLTAVALAACGDDDDDGGNGGNGGGGGGQAAELDLHTDGQLTIGAEFPVKGFVELPIDDPKGFEVDLGDAIAKELGVPKVQWKNTPFTGLFSPAPKDFDMAINEITITEDRSRVVDFSVPYFDANQGFVIKKGGPAEGVQSIAEMKDLQFGVQATTTGAAYVKDEIQPDSQPREFSTLPALTQALVNGQVDAMLMDVAISAEIVKERREDVEMTGEFITDERYGILFEKGNALRQPVNEALRKLEANGTLERLQAKWFPGTEDLPELQ